jgi:hypothetical protein
VNIEGGAALPITISTDAPSAGPALPVYVLTAATLDRKIEGGPSMRVYFVSDAQIAAGTFRVEGRIHALPVYAVTDGRRITGDDPVPVYRVNP